ncbi:MAG TPA: Do family serine endopeptidase [bacterium]|jgi:serine protease Do
MDSNTTQRNRGAFGIIFIIVLLIGIGIGVVASSELGWIPELNAQSTRSSGPGPAAVQPSNFLVSTQESFRELVASAKPAVVSIEAIGTREAGGNFDFKNPLEEFFGFPHPDINPDQQENMIPSIASGSGFVVDPDGYILTNNHVVSGADEVKVKFEDGRQLDAEVVGTDTETDVAVLKVNANRPLEYIELGDSENLMVGDWVMAVGNPFGTLAGTVTVGIVSAKNRETINLPGTVYYENFIQTDAAINLGNSGGPLIDIYGRAVGINTAITASGSGIGFAIPINLARFVYESLRDHGEVIRSWIGVTIQNIDDEDLANRLGLENLGGALVADLRPGDPADAAGLQQGDILLEVAGQSVASVQTASRLIAMLPVGEPSEFLVLRNGREMTIDVTPVQRGQGPTRAGEEISQNTQDERNVPEEEDDVYGQYLGIDVVDLDSKYARGVDIPSDVTGVLIKNVEFNSPGYDKGISAGEIIISVNDNPVENVDDYRRLMDVAYDDWQHDGTTVLLRVLTMSSNGEYFPRFVAVPFE